MPTEDFSPNLGLPYLLPNQAQKHVTVNESLRAFDILVMASVEAVGIDTPPSEPNEGEAWIVGSAPSAAWVGYAHEIAAWQDGAWMFYAPHVGWRVWDRLNSVLSVYDGSSWTALQTGAGGGGGLSDTQNLDFIGLATTADVDNPFTARLNSALWMALESTDGGTGDIRLSVNKQSDANTASIILQSGFVGHTEFGLVGTADFSLRVSADGTAWTSAMLVDRETAHIGLGTSPDSTNRLTVNGRLQVVTENGSFKLHDKGRLEIGRNSGAAVQLRGTSPGSPLTFDVTDNTGTLFLSALKIDPDTREIESACDFVPSTSISLDLGKSDQVWRDLFVQNAPTVLSDERCKQDINALKQAPQLLSALKPVSFRRSADGPIHFGFIAQDVRKALDTAGFGDVGLWRLSEAEDPNSQQVLRQEELIAVLVATMQELSGRLERIETFGGAT